MPRPLIEFSYRVDISSEVSAPLPAAVASLIGADTMDRESQTFRAALGEEGLWLQYGSADENPKMLHLGLASGRRMLLDPGTKEARVEPGNAYQARSANIDAAGAEWYVIDRTQVQVAGRELEVERCEANVPTGRIEALFALDSLGAAGAAVAELTRGMLPLDDAMISMERVPVQVELHLGGVRQVSVLLTDLCEVDADKYPSCVPSDYEEIDHYEAAQPREQTKIEPLSPAVRPFVPPLRVDAELQRLAHLREAQVQQRDDWVNPMGDAGDELAWLCNQPLLDQLRTVLNRICSVFNRFSGDGSGGDENMHVMLNWWQRLQPRLQFENEDEAMAAIRRIWLAYQVMQARSLVGLTPEEQATYAEGIVAGNALSSGFVDLFGMEVARYLAFVTLFDAQRVEQLEQAEFLTLTEPVKLDFGVDELEKRNLLDLMHVRAWDFDTAIRLPGENTIERLEHGDGCIELEFKLEQIRVDFQFSTRPSSSSESILWGLITGGGTTAMSTNYGYGFFEISDARLAMQITSVPEGAVQRLQVSVDPRRSQMDVDAAVFGVNLVQNVVDAIVAAVISWGEELDGTILDEAAGGLTDALQGAPLQWPAVWTASGGPALRTAGASDGVRCLRGALVAPLSRIPNPTAADPGRVAGVGYALSRRYLTAWLCELCGQYTSGETRIEVDWEQGLGIDLPPLAGYPLPDLSDDGYEIDRYYETRLVRQPPRVIFPESGSVTRAGQVEVLVDVELRAMLTELRENSSQPPEVGWADQPQVLDPNASIHAGAYGDALRPPLDAHMSPRMGASMLRNAVRGRQWSSIQQFGRAPRALAVSAPPVAHPVGHEYEHCLATLLRVRLRMRADLQLGFNARGSMWLPELRLAVDAVQGEARLGEETADIETESVFDAAPRDAILSLVRPICQQELRSILQPAVFTGSDAPRTSRALVPGELEVLNVPDDILNLLTFSQAGDTDALRYQVVGSLLYWPVVLDENVTRHIV